MVWEVFFLASLEGCFQRSGRDERKNFQQSGGLPAFQLAHARI